MTIVFLLKADLFNADLHTEPADFSHATQILCFNTDDK